MMITMKDKIKDLEDREITLKADNDKLKSDVEVKCLTFLFLSMTMVLVLMSLEIFCERY